MSHYSSSTQHPFIHPSVHPSIRHLWHLSFITHGPFRHTAKSKIFDCPSVCRQINSIQPWYDTLFDVLTAESLFISLKHNVTFTCNHFTLGDTMENPSSSYCVRVFNISFFPPVHYFLHTESSKPTKCLVLYFSCSLRPSNIQRIGFLHFGLPSLAFQISLKRHPAAPQKHMHISGAVTWGWCKGRAPRRLAKTRPEMMTHTAK